MQHGTHKHIIEVKMRFEYAHRLLRYTGKCHHVHGHSGLARFEFQAPQLDHEGFVAEFGSIKLPLKNWIDENWDHGYIAHIDDPLLDEMERLKLKIYPMTVEATAENMAMELYHKAESILDGGDARSRLVVCRRVWLHETETGAACYEN